MQEILELQAMFLPKVSVLMDKHCFQQLILGRVEASNLVTADANRDISNARNLRVTGDVSAQSFSIDGQTLLSTSILGRVSQ